MRSLTELEPKKVIEGISSLSKLYGFKDWKKAVFMPDKDGIDFDMKLLSVDDSAEVDIRIVNLPEFFVISCNGVTYNLKSNISIDIDKMNKLLINKDDLIGKPHYVTPNMVLKMPELSPENRTRIFMLEELDGDETIGNYLVFYGFPFYVIGNHEIIMPRSFKYTAYKIPENDAIGIFGIDFMN